MLIASVPLPPFAMEREEDAGASVKLAGAVTVRAMVAVAVRLPDVPVMVTVLVPAAAALVAAKITALDAVAGFVAKLAVTPAGSPVAARVTVPVKPPAPATVTVSVALPPAATATVGVTAAMVKLGATTLKLCTTTGAAAYAESPAWFASTVQVPAPRNDASEPATVQTPGVVEANVTGSPEVAVAESVSFVPTDCVPGLGKAIAWAVP
jgi:hypothetical protein